MTDACVVTAAERLAEAVLNYTTEPRTVLAVPGHRCKDCGVWAPDHRALVHEHGCVTYVAARIRNRIDDNTTRYKRLV